MRTINPAKRQQQFNRATQGNWDTFTEHRERLTRLLEEIAAATVASASSSKSLCILGAGNCNDIDLPKLVSQWSRIRLVDLDMEAMQGGVARQFHMRPPSQVECSTCDVTGALEYCHEFIHSPRRDTLNKLRQALALLPAVERIGEKFSCVVSTCLLSQLTDIVRHALGESSPELMGLIKMVHLQHLRTLAELTSDGGTMVALVDFVSSETLPQLRDVSAGALPGLMQRALGEENFFTGMNPLAIGEMLSRPPLDSYWVESPRMLLPWRWNLGPRMYMVTAFLGRRV
jgi:hypothetical protein